MEPVKVLPELGRMLNILVLTVLSVALLWRIPYVLIPVLLIPLAVSWWFWPHPSTILSYIVAAVFGTLLTSWSLLGAVQQPQAPFLTSLWAGLVWGPAGILIKRVEWLIKARKAKNELPEF
jgi:hypothetical protein